MTKQQQFEHWFLREMDIDVSGMRNDDPNTNTEWPYNSGVESSSLVITVAFKAWMASTAPAVPEAIITAPIEAMRCGPAASYVLGWNACRAAMLGGAK